MKISKDPQKNWENNQIQFPRLIAEMESVGFFNCENPAVVNLVIELTQEMEIDTRELSQLIDRAQTEWDLIKEKTKSCISGK